MRTKTKRTDNKYYLVRQDLHTAIEQHKLITLPDVRAYLRDVSHVDNYFMMALEHEEIILCDYIGNTVRWGHKLPTLALAHSTLQSMRRIRSQRSSMAKKKKQGQQRMPLDPPTSIKNKRVVKSYLWGLYRVEKEL